MLGYLGWVHKPRYLAQLPIAHNPGFLVARVPRPNPRYLGQLPIANNPGFLVARVPRPNRRYPGQLPIATRCTGLWVAMNFPCVDALSHWGVPCLALEMVPCVLNLADFSGDCSRWHGISPSYNLSSESPECILGTCSTDFKLLLPLTLTVCGDIPKTLL